MLQRGTPVNFDPLPAPQQSTKGSVAVKYLHSRNEARLLSPPSLFNYPTADIVMTVKEGKTDKVAVQRDSSAFLEKRQQVAMLIVLGKSGFFVSQKLTKKTKTYIYL